MTVDAADAVEMITIEYRVVFGDYNDDEIAAHEYTNHAPRLWIKDSNNFSKGFFMDSNEIGTPKQYSETFNGVEYTATYERVDDNTAARKDWCYQYKLTLNVPKKENAAAGEGYYINAVQDRQNNRYGYHNDFRIANFTPYILDYEHFNHPGSAPNTAYNGDISSVKVNDNKIVYLFLDPKTDWQNASGTPKTIDLSMKKRWDGHNASGFDTHQKEKIAVELQVRKSDGSWEKFTGNYSNKSYYNNANKNFVDKNKVSLKFDYEVADEDRLKFLTTDGYKD